MQEVPAMWCERKEGTWVIVGSFQSMGCFESVSLKCSLPGNAIQWFVRGTLGSSGEGDLSSSAVFILEIRGECHNVFKK